MDFYAAGTDVARYCVGKACAVCEERIEIIDDIYADVDETVGQRQHARCFEIAGASWDSQAAGPVRLAETTAGDARCVVATETGARKQDGLAARRMRRPG